MSTYDLLSKFYDLENADFTEDLDFWVSLAKQSGGTVLELGCGSARVTQQIARAGLHVVGIDHSQPMLDLARAKLNRKAELAARAELVLGSILDYDLGRRFNAIIVPFNTFMHLLEPAEQIAALTCARRHLPVGGKLALDLTNPAPAYRHSETHALTLERTFRDEARNLTIQQFSTLRVDLTAQIAHILWQYDTIAADGALNRTLVPLTLRYSFPAEISLLLDRCGLKLTHLYGDYDETPLDDDSERMIVIAEAA